MDELKQWLDAVGRRFVVDQLGINPSTVSHWVTGRTRPSPEHAVALERLSRGKVKAAKLVLPDEAA